MTLQKQLVPITFSGGVDTKTAKQLVLPGKFLLLDNCVRRDGDKIQKRFGFSHLSKNTAAPYQSATSTGPTTESNLIYGTELARFKSELLMLDSENFQLFSYLRSSDEWISRQKNDNHGKMSLLTTGHIDSTSIVRNSHIQAMPDLATIGARSVIVWEDSRGGSRYSIFDNTTNEIIVADTQITATGSRPKVLAINNNFIILYYDGGSLKRRIVHTNNITNITSEFTLIAATMADSPWDCTNFLSYGIFVINTTSSSLLVGYLDFNGVIGNPGSNGLPSPIVIAKPADLAIAIQGDAINNRIAVCYVDDSDNTIYVSFMDYAFNLIMTNTVTGGGNIRNITMFGSLDATSTTSFRMEYEINNTIAGGAKRNIIKLVNLSWDGISPPIANNFSTFHDKRGVGLTIKGVDAGLHSFTISAFDSTLQSTYFIHGPGFHNDGDSSIICARIAAGVGNGYTKDPSQTEKSGLSKASILSDGSIIFPVQIKNNFQAIDGKVTSTNIGIEIVKFTFPTPYYSTDTLGENLHIAGSVMLHYDGTQLFEDNFHIFPEDLNFAVTSPGAGGTFLVTGDYSYQVTYEWVDGKGQLHRSAPSILEAVTIDDVTKEVNIEIPYLTTLTNYTRDIQIVIYRSAANLSDVLYKLATIPNSPDSGIVTYIDSNSDGTDLTTRQFIYTTGGVLENIPVPASKIVHKHGNRLVITGLEDQTLVQYSREWVPQEPVQFNDTLTIRTDELGGKVTTVSTLDDKLIIFKADRMFTVAGQGPTDNGQQNDFTNPQLISSDVGTVEPLSVVIMPMGLMFKSQKGIYLLSRNLDSIYIGAAVEEYNNLTITSATVLTSTNEVRFTTSDGVALVYNYFFDQWSTFANYEAQSSILDIDGSFLHLKIDGTVNKEIKDQYNDNGTRYSQNIETSWFSLNGIEGFQRIYRISVLGDFLSNHYTQMDIAYNFQDVYNQTVYFNTLTGLNSSTYGSDSPYGGTSPYGDTGNQVYQFRVKPARQKCEAMKIRLRDIDTIMADGGGSFSLVHMAFEVGVKEGINKQSASKSL